MLHNTAMLPPHHNNTSSARDLGVPPSQALEAEGREGVRRASRARGPGRGLPMGSADGELRSYQREMCRKVQAPPCGSADGYGLSVSGGVHMLGAPRPGAATPGSPAAGVPATALACRPTSAGVALEAAVVPAAAAGPGPWLGTNAGPTVAALPRPQAASSSAQPSGTCTPAPPGTSASVGRSMVLHTTGSARPTPRGSASVLTGWHPSPPASSVATFSSAGSYPSWSSAAPGEVSWATAGSSLAGDSPHAPGPAGEVSCEGAGEVSSTEALPVSPVRASRAKTSATACAVGLTPVGSCHPCRGVAGDATPSQRGASAPAQSSALHARAETRPSRPTCSLQGSPAISGAPAP
mmetsp:Transcript_6311/g.19001  ORF Transcript_6311/g.19001 Transcript_6311/m.19001 type:complete len:352 (+) Transcript_6311:128-1183(+)